MTINQLIKALEGEREFGDVWIADADAKAIATALRRLEAVVEAAKAWAWVHEPSTMQEQELADALTATGEDA